jgi:hypothetical protein
MKKQFNRGTVDEGLGIVFLVLAIIFFVCTANFHIPNSGQHTGYVTSVEQSGIIWKTWTAYIKTDPQSSQEDTYCVTDSKTVTALQSAETEKSSVTVNYSVPWITWKWQCGYEQSTIQSINNSGASNDSSTNQQDTSTITESVYQFPQLSFAYPYQYGASVVNTGGDWRTTIIKAYTINGDLLLPPENYIATDISNGGLMWVGCKNGYQTINATSPTPNKICKEKLPSDIGQCLDTYDSAMRNTNTKYIMDIVCQKK